MASQQITRSKRPPAAPDASEGTKRRATLGLLNGMLIGLGLAIGLWSAQLYSLLNVLTPLQFQALIMGAVLLMAIGGFAGWLSSRLGRTGLTVLIWLLAALVMTFLVGYLPSHGRNLAVWLVDRRFWGLSVYPAPTGAAPAVTISGLFIVLLLLVFAAVQDYRLDGIQGTLEEGDRFSPATWIRLLLPVPLMILGGLYTANIVGESTGPALRAVDEVISTGRAYEGDLFEFSREAGVNYNAIRGLQAQMRGDYTLMIAEVDTETATTFVVAHFSGGGWITCRVIGDQPSFCYDASLPYTQGLASLITGEAVPEDCIGCLPLVGETWREWLAARGARFNGRPEPYRLAQRGSYVYMRVEAPTDGYAIDCLFRGISPVRLAYCSEVGP